MLRTPSAKGPAAIAVSAAERGRGERASASDGCHNRRGAAMPVSGSALRGPRLLHGLCCGGACMRAVFLFLRALHGKPLSIFSCACVGSCCRRASCSFISTPFICRQHPCSLVALLRGSARRKRFEGQPSCRCCTQSQRRSSFVCCTSKGSISLLLSLRRQSTCKVSFGAANAEWIRVASKWISRSW